jgi:hypothetical protein
MCIYKYSDNFIRSCCQKNPSPKFRNRSNMIANIEMGCFRNCFFRNQFGSFKSRPAVEEKSRSRKPVIYENVLTRLFFFLLVAQRFFPDEKDAFFFTKLDWIKLYFFLLVHLRFFNCFLFFLFRLVSESMKKSKVYVSL